MDEATESPEQPMPDGWITVEEAFSFGPYSGLLTMLRDYSLELLGEVTARYGDADSSTVDDVSKLKIDVAQRLMQIMSESVQESMKREHDRRPQA